MRTRRQQSRREGRHRNAPALVVRVVRVALQIGLDQDALRDAETLAALVQETTAIGDLGRCSSQRELDRVGLLEQIVAMRVVLVGDEHEAMADESQRQGAGLSWRAVAEAPRLVLMNDAWHTCVLVAGRRSMVALGVRGPCRLECSRLADVRRQYLVPQTTPTLLRWNREFGRDERGRW